MSRVSLGDIHCRALIAGFVIAVSIMLSACQGVSTFTKGEETLSYELIQQAARQGDWLRILTTDGTVHETRYISVDKDAIQGGDAVISLSDIESLELHPLIDGGGYVTKSRQLLSDQEFVQQFEMLVKGMAGEYLKVTIANGEVYQLEAPTLLDGNLIGQEIDIWEMDAEDILDNYESPGALTIPLDSIVAAKEAYIRTPGHLSEIYRIRSLQSEALLTPTSWVHIELNDGVVSEFRITEKTENELYGGDGSRVNLDDVASLELVPATARAPTAGEVILGTVLVVGYAALMFGAGVPVVPAFPAPVP
ncbi:MAG: hypothetical protein ACWA5Q_07300 [bacterium]